jgi:general secretion pathway protein J
MKLRALGFTLIEMLVALAVFSILSVLAYRALDAVLALDERSANMLVQDSARHRAMAILLQDLLHVRPRVVRDERNDYQRAYEVSEEYAVRFTRGGLPMLASMPAGMQRIAYTLNDDKELLRLVWPQLDSTSDLEPQSQVLLVGVEEFVVEQLDESNSFVNAWPPVNEDASLHKLPKMIRITIEFEGGSKLERLIPGVESSTTRQVATDSEEAGAL